jgi:hypothetical protein
MSNVIYDNECREYKEGWNANNRGAHYLSNPYSCIPYDGELYRLWQKGFDENQMAWDKGPNNPIAFTDVNQSFSITLPNDCQDYLPGDCVFNTGSCKQCSIPQGKF